mmetsp:Transcript_12399/g.31098  ORF Transcript_12399/g.31098 Transcript_12399/m.31098 type:complete len:281 (-) Transcript_12399:411-1253(-)
MVHPHSRLGQPVAAITLTSALAVELPLPERAGTLDLSLMARSSTCASRRLAGVSFRNRPLALSFARTSATYHFSTAAACSSSCFSFSRLPSVLAAVCARNACVKKFDASSERATTRTPVVMASKRCTSLGLTSDVVVLALFSSKRRPVLSTSETHALPLTPCRPPGWHAMPAGLLMTAKSSSWYRTRSLSRFVAADTAFLCFAVLLLLSADGSLSMFAYDVAGAWSATNDCGTHMRMPGSTRAVMRTRRPHLLVDTSANLSSSSTSSLDLLCSLLSSPST